MKFTQKLKNLDACADAVEWAGQYKSLQEAWDNCERGDWMLWLLGRLSGEPGSDKRRKIVLATTDCALLARPYANDKEAFDKCLETARQWARGEGDVTLEQVRAAAVAIDAAAVAAEAAAVATYAAAFAAAFAAYAAAFAADAAYVSRIETLKKCAEIVRKHFPKAPKL